MTVLRSETMRLFIQTTKGSLSRRSLWDSPRPIEELGFTIGFSEMRVYRFAPSLSRCGCLLCRSQYICVSHHFSHLGLLMPVGDFGPNTDPSLRANIGFCRCHAYSR